MKWYRVNKKNRCKVCDHPDWCGYTDGAAICMRVESDTPTRNGGWLHRSDTATTYVPIRQAIPDKPIDAERVYRQYRKDDQALDQLAVSLGVDTDALKAVGCAWAGTAWAFPMKDAKEKIVGIRLRDECGNKWAVRGSKSGLFISTKYSFIPDGCLYLVEGPTDLAAAMSIGLRAIGRPACLGQEEMILTYIKLSKAERLVIVTDNDDPGLRGAEKLQGLLSILSCIWVPPTKDIREFLNLGGNYRMIQSSIKDLVWTKARRAA